MTESERRSWFERDVDGYLRALPRLLDAEEGEGKFVLIRSGEVVAGFHGSYEAAMAFGYQHFPGELFLVKEVSSKDREVAHHLEPCRA
jgi:hypothetical protein